MGMLRGHASASVLLIALLGACGGSDVQPVLACGSGNGGCDLHASCSVPDAGAGVTCTCLPGYVGDGHSCTNVAASLGGLRWELPCGSSTSSAACTASDITPITSTLGGAAGTSYDVVLRFRGVVEQKGYTGGTNDGMFLQIGGTPDADPYNVYALAVSSPAQTYYLNRGTSGQTRCYGIDYTHSIRVAAGATVTMTALAIDGAEIKNLDGGGQPIVVAGVPPAPGTFDGQFIQMDVVSLTAVP
jgi:hypothetical protein